MARPSKLTDQQWSEAVRRILAGETYASVAAFYKVGVSTVKNQVIKRSAEIKNVANQVVEAERNLARLPIVDQMVALDLASALRSVSSDLAQAAKYGAATAHRMTMIANKQTDFIDPTMPNSAESLTAQSNINRLTETANEAAKIPLNLLSAGNKKIVEEIDAATARSAASSQVSSSMDAAQAASEYQKLMG